MVSVWCVVTQFIMCYVMRWIRLLNLNFMEKKFSVYFSHFVDKAELEIASFPTIEQSIPFALDLHRLSNIPHWVTVRLVGSDVVVLTLALESKS